MQNNFMFFDRKKKNQPVNMEIIAISLAASKAGMSYGQFSLGLSKADKEMIISKYREEICGNKNA